MKKLNEQLNRSKELMGILSEQDGKAVNVKPEEFVCDRCRWNGLKTYLLANDGSETGMIELELTLYNHTGNDTDRIERFVWEGEENKDYKGHMELERKGEEVNKKYNIDIEIPELNGFMEKEEEETGPEMGGPRTPGKKEIYDHNDIFNGDDAGDGQYRSDRDRHRRNPYSAKARFRAGLGKSL